MYEFGEFLYQLRKEKGWTQAELADRLGVTNKAVSKWETGESFPETGQLVPISSLFEVTVDELLRGKKDETIDRESLKLEEVVIKLKPYTKGQTAAIAIAIGLILVGLTLLIVLETIGSFGRWPVTMLFFAVSCAVFILVFTSKCRSLGSIEIDEKEMKRGKTLGAILSLGISTVILSPIPIIIMSVGGIDIAIFFAILALAIPIIIFSAIQWGNFAKKHNLPSDEITEPKGKLKVIKEGICSFIMLTATMIFLLLGFLKSLWGSAWVVFPIAGVVCAIVAVVIQTISRKD